MSPVVSDDHPTRFFDRSAMSLHSILDYNILIQRKKMCIQRVCKNCMDYDQEKQVCTIRYTILKDKTKTPLKRKPDQSGCSVFLMK